jgi:hypothetical protein
VPGGEAEGDGGRAGGPRPSAVAIPPAAPAAGGTLPPEERRPRRLERTPAAETPAQRAKMRRLDQEVAAAEEAEGSPPSPQPPTAGVPRAETPAARALAKSWFDAFTRGDVSAMVGQAAFPFKSTGGNAVASSRGDLTGMLRALVDETPAASRAVTSLQVLTAASLRGAIGRLPQGLDDGSGLLFALAHTAGNDTLILVLSPRSDGWKASGLARR